MKKTLASALFLVYVLLLALFVLLICSCQQTGSAPRLQQHLAAAKTSSQQTATHIQGTKSHLDTADYKGGRAKKLLDQGIERP